nr:unnamed protein product [Digitaria exilis]
MPAQGHKLPGRVTPWWVSARPSPDAPRRLHLVELQPNAKGLSSLAQAPAATPQTPLAFLARLQAPDLQHLVRASTVRSCYGNAPIPCRSYIRGDDEQDKLNDVLHEVLLRLPADVLCRLRLVESRGGLVISSLALLGQIPSTGQYKVLRIHRYLKHNETKQICEVKWRPHSLRGFYLFDDSKKTRRTRTKVLLYLPADELCRLRLVCRSWWSLTSDPIFAKAHSSRHPLIVGLRHNRGFYDVHFVDPFSGNVVKQIPTGRSWYVHRVSTDHGRLCISGDDRYDPEKNLVLNPANGAITMLPTTSIVTKYVKESTSYGRYTCLLGWVPSTGEYKVLRMRHRHGCQNLLDDVELDYHIATLGGDGNRDSCWRVMPRPPVLVAIGSLDRVVVKGVAYFLLDLDLWYWRAKSDDIVEFDLATEEWRYPMLRGPFTSHKINAEEEDRHALQRNGNKRSKLHAPFAAANDSILPTDVLRDVLLRLPADELCRLRLVCRSWRSLTSDPFFAKAHLSRHPLIPDDHRDLEVQFLDPSSGGIVKRILMVGPEECYELSAHHWRVCISNRYPDKAYMLYPAAGSFTMLPTSCEVTEHENNRTITYVSVLGWVPSTGEYKALCIRHGHGPEQSYHIATLGTDGSICCSGGLLAATT